MFFTPAAAVTAAAVYKTYTYDLDDPQRAVWLLWQLNTDGCTSPYMPTSLYNSHDTTFTLQLAPSSTKYKFVLESCLEVVYLLTRVPEASHLHNCIISQLQ